MEVTISDIIVFLATLLAIVIFEFIKLPAHVSKLTGLYQQQFSLMADKNMDELDKQRELLKLISPQLKGIGILFVLIVLFVSPFLVLVLADGYIDVFDASALMTIRGVAISFIAVFIYIMIKRLYGRVRVFRNG